MRKWSKLAVGLLCAASIAAAPVRAEVAEVRISKGYGISYLPLMIVQEQKLFEKAAEKAGLGSVATSWKLIDGGNNVNDAMLAGAIDIAGIGIAGFLVLWAKAKGRPASEVGALANLSAVPVVLTTRNPKIRSLKDFTSADKIAVAGIKTSQAAILLQMAVAQVFGDAEYAKLDPLTVGMAYPEAYAAMVSGKTEINSHFASPPYGQMELDQPGIHLVLNSVEALGEMTSNVVFSSTRFVEANPKTSRAFIDALEEANAFITRDPEGAAEVFIRATNAKSTPAEILRMIQDKTTKFSTSPDGTMKFADFLNRVGIIKVKAARWQDYFFPLGQFPSGS